MKLAIGLAIVVLGIVLLVMGIRESDSIASQFTEFFTGNPTDRAMWLILGGIAAIIVGLGASVAPVAMLKKR
jgi:ABC-type uncharacterized transport system permease subunit